MKPNSGMRRGAGAVLLAVMAIYCSSPVLGQADADGVYVITQPERSAEAVEKAYAQIPPVKYEPPADRWKRLPRTAGILRLAQQADKNRTPPADPTTRSATRPAGPELRVVMLGDSIINDTSRSGWDRLIEQRHPGLTVTKITCVRGSTGCWWYKDPGRVKRYVLDHHPDLLIIGGISQRDDIDSIGDVVAQVRKESKCDVLLLTGAFGAVDPRDDKQWQFEIDPQSSDYRARLKRLAEEVHIGFLDMTGLWGRYIRQSGKDLAWFKRDPIHANDKGEQILGRLLAGHLSLD